MHRLRWSSVSEHDSISKCIL